MPIYERRCSQCSRKYELYYDGLELTAFGRADGEEHNLDCPTCGSDQYQQLCGGAVGIKLGGDAGVGRHYPYFDRALGCEVRDHQHREHLMTHYNDSVGTPREVKLEPTDGAVNFADWATAERYQAEEDEKVYNEVMEEQTTGPNKEKYGKLQQMIADGWMPPALEEASTAPIEVVLQQAEEASPAPAAPEVSGA